VDFSLNDLTMCFLTNDVIRQTWAYSIDERLESDWVILDSEQNTIHYQQIQQSPKMPLISNTLKRFFYNRKMSRQWPPEDILTESSVEDISLCPVFVLASNPLNPLLYFLVEWFNADQILVHLFTLLPITSHQTQIEIRYEYFASEGTEGVEEDEYLRSRMVSLWWQRFYRLFGSFEIATEQTTQSPHFSRSIVLSCSVCGGTLVDDGKYSHCEECNAVCLETSSSDLYTSSHIFIECK
jgi:hypothetical protein